MQENIKVKISTITAYIMIVACTIIGTVILVAMLQVIFTY